MCIHLCSSSQTLSGLAVGALCGKDVNAEAIEIAKQFSANQLHYGKEGQPCPGALLMLFQMQAKILVQVTTQPIEPAREDARKRAVEDSQTLVKKKARTECRNSADHSYQQQRASIHRCCVCAKNQASKRCSNGACGRCCQHAAEACLQHGTAEKPRASLVSRTKAEELRRGAKTNKNEFDDDVYMHEVDLRFQDLMNDGMRDVGVPVPATPLPL